MRSSYKTDTVSINIISALDINPLKDLRDELHHWLNGLEGTNLEMSRKYDDITESCQLLNDVLLAISDDIEGVKRFVIENRMNVSLITVTLTLPKCKRARASRIVRLTNKLIMLNAALNLIEENTNGLKKVENYETIFSRIGRIRDELVNLESIEFPKYYG